METITAELAWNVFKKSDRLYSVDEVELALSKMATAINKDLQGQNPLIVCIMTGGVVPLGIILPKLNFPLQLDYIHVTRYGDKLHGGTLQWITEPSINFKDRVVLLVDDILDEGETLAQIEQRYLKDGARKVYKAVLVTKDRERQCDIKPDYVGLSVPDRYVFGYGMDYKGYLRNVPGIFAEVEE